MENYPVINGKIIPPITIGPYTIKYNEFWKTYQCILDGTIYAEFDKVGEAIAYCRKG